MTRDESGFTLVETMVAMLLLSIVSVGIYQVMFSSVRGADSTQEVSQISQNARLGLNRIVRDTREASQVVRANGSSYAIWVDFDGNDLVTDYEYLKYEYTGSQITLTPLAPPSAGNPAGMTGSEPTLAGESPAVVIDRVVQIGSPARSVFSYASNFLQFDTNGNGEVGAIELDAAGGSVTGVPDGPELGYVSTVNYSFGVRVSGRQTNFFTQAELRNRRYSNL